MSDFQSTIANIARNVTKTSGDLLKSTKLSMSLSSEEANLKNIHYEIGKKVHEIYQYGGSLGEFFDAKYYEIEECERKIADLKEQIGVIKGTRDCPKCGKKVERIAEFCPKCGLRQDARGAETMVEPSGAIPHDASQTPPVTPPSAAWESAPVPPSPAPTPPTPAPAPPVPTPVPVEPPPIPPQIEKKCRVCGANNESTAKFCLSCGRIID
ncbi:MAG: zinc ribbon domain-containing protein [Defluviitaleaceae bacterium]|nr:zinc ribbon domain-containing protein [Defluviitaleaceae bacterium]